MYFYFQAIETVTISFFYNQFLITLGVNLMDVCMPLTKRCFFIFLQNVTFKVNYMKKPAVVISSTHNSSTGLLPDFNSITSWIEV